MDPNDTLNSTYIKWCVERKMIKKLAKETVPMMCVEDTVL